MERSNRAKSGARTRPRGVGVGNTAAPRGVSKTPARGRAQIQRGTSSRSRTAVLPKRSGNRGRSAGQRTNRPPSPSKVQIEREAQAKARAAAEALEAATALAVAEEEARLAEELANADICEDLTTDIVFAHPRVLLSLDTVELPAISRNGGTQVFKWRPELEGRVVLVACGSVLQPQRNRTAAAHLLQLSQLVERMGGCDVTVLLCLCTQWIPRSQKPNLEDQLSVLKESYGLVPGNEGSKTNKKDENGENTGAESGGALRYTSGSGRRASESRNRSIDEAKEKEVKSTNESKDENVQSQNLNTDVNDKNVDGDKTEMGPFEVTSEVIMADGGKGHPFLRYLKRAARNKSDTADVSTDFGSYFLIDGLGIVQWRLDNVFPVSFESKLRMMS